MLVRRSIGAFLGAALAAAAMLVPSAPAQAAGERVSHARLALARQAPSADLPPIRAGAHVWTAAADVPHRVGVLGVTWPGAASGATVWLRTTDAAGSRGSWQQADDPETTTSDAGVVTTGTGEIVLTGVARVEVSVVGDRELSPTLSVYSSAVTAADAAAASSAGASARDAPTVRPAAGTAATRAALASGFSPAAGPVETARDQQAAASMPPVRTRADWGADESIVRLPYQHGRVSGVMIHHTATTNTYAAADVPAILRSIQAYHVNDRGWRDMAYNVLVDRFGVAWEGRGGGLIHAISGGHAYGITNDNVFGLSFLGNYDLVAAPAPMLDAAERLIAWKFRIHGGVDPYGTTIGSGGGAAAGTGRTTLNAISGHRDEARKSCPGDLVYSRMGEIRSKVAGYLASYPLLPVEPEIPGDFGPLTPARLLDTRTGLGASGPVAPGGQIDVQVTGRGGVPTELVGAVVLNVTATDATSNGFVTVFPSGEAAPTASNLNYASNETVPNLVVAKVGADGRVSLLNSSTGTVQLVADVAGWYRSGAPVEPGTFAALSPARLLDTRSGVGAVGPVAPGGRAVVKVAGRGGVPATGAAAVWLNVTATEPTAIGTVTVHPTDVVPPTVSNLNVQPGQTVPNLVLVKLAADGTVALDNNSTGTIQLVADVAGYVRTGLASDLTIVNPSATGSLVTLPPQRVLDTRYGVGAAAAAVAPHGMVRLKVAGAGGVWPARVAAVVLNVTATQGTAPGFVTAYPSDAPPPTASNVNYAPGQDVPNLVVVRVAPDGSIALRNNSAGTVHLVADVSGFLLS